MHSFPWDKNGHKGDLPGLFVAADGTAVTPVLAPKLKSVNELKGHSLMIHVGGDNYHDHPAKLGGGGARMACGSIKYPLPLPVFVPAVKELLFLVESDLFFHGRTIFFRG